MDSSTLFCYSSLASTDITPAVSIPAIYNYPAPHSVNVGIGPAAKDLQKLTFLMKILLNY